MIDQKLLEQLFSTPTAPLHELQIQTLIESWLARKKIPFFKDPWGNLLVGVKNRQHLTRLLKQRSREPLRMFVAHMDHPGFEGKRIISSTELEIRWLGGSPTKHMEGARIWVCNPDGKESSGTLHHPQLHSSGRYLESATIRLDHPQDAKNIRKLFGGWAFRAAFWQEGDLLYARALDDLAGVFSILQIAQAANKKKSPFLGLLTRSEEIGFVGMLRHLELGWLKNAKRPILTISIEASRTLPGAEIGKGPIIRLGDKTAVFDTDSLQVITQLAQKILPETHQRRIMDGGTCEAMASIAFGIPAIGMAIPLGNYHNQSFEGGPDAAPENGPAPEFVSMTDLTRVIKLGIALLSPGLPWNDPWRKRRNGILKNMRKYRL